MRPVEILPIVSMVVLSPSLCLSSSARQAPPRPRMVDPSEYVVQVTVPGRLPMEIPVSRQGSGAAGLPLGRRVAGAVADPGNPKPETAEVAAKMDGEMVRVDLNLAFDNDRKETVATYRLREGETIDVAALSNYEIGSFTIRVVLAKPLVEDPTPTDQLQITNNVPSLQVLRFEKADASSTSYQLEVRNLSNKDILCVDLYIPDPENHGSSGQRAGGWKRRPLIKSGEVWKTDVSNGRSGRTTSQGFVPQPPRVKTLIVRAIVFDDGAYEGDPEAAAEIEAMRLGQKVTYLKAIDLLEGALRQGEVIQWLQEAVYAIPKQVSDDLLDGIISRFPSLSDGVRSSLKFQAESSARTTKQMVIRQIEMFKESATRSSEGTNLHDWLARTIAESQKHADVQ